MFKGFEYTPTYIYNMSFNHDNKILGYIMAYLQEHEGLHANTICKYFALHDTTRATKG